jgi:hypothetical protein
MAEEITVICGNCEREWDADERAATDPCTRPVCGFHDVDGEENIIRIEADHAPRASQVPPHMASLVWPEPDKKAIKEKEGG